MVYLTSDLHFGHQKSFLWEPRGFSSSAEHDITIIKNWNELITPEDDVYVLGDLMLGDSVYGLECLRQLNGKLHLIRGNHDTDTRWNELYPTAPNIIEFCGWATILKYKKYHFYLSHWATDTTNYDDGREPWARLISLSGHTHQPNKFHDIDSLKYNVALDAHNNKPVLLDDIIQDIKNAISS